MERLLYLIARALVAVILMLPMRVVARIGRAGGGLAYCLDARHRRVAIQNLTLCFGSEKSPAEIRALARENFRRIGENYATSIRSATMSLEDLRPHLSLTGREHIALTADGQRPRGTNLVLILGHFGNFELYNRLGQFLPSHQLLTTYRGLRQPSLNRLMQSLRERSGTLYYERRFDGAALKARLNQPGFMLGLLVDQRTAKGGIPLPFFGRECSTNVAPAVFARRYRTPLQPVICYRVGLARWQLEFGPEIPTRADGAARTTEAIMRDVNAALEVAVRRDPANWFWVHNRWKAPPAKEKLEDGG